MLSEKHQSLILSDAYLSFVRKRSRLAWGLCIFLTTMVFVFNLLSSYAPALTGHALWSGSVISVGIAFAFFCIAAVMVTAAYYVHWVNKHYIALMRSADASDGGG